MQPGALLSQLRKDKGLSISDLCQGILPKSTYFRYIKGETAIPYDTLAALTQRLNLSLDEFTYLLQGQQATSWVRHLDTLAWAMETRDCQTIRSLASHLPQAASQAHETYADLVALTRLCQQALTHQPLDIPSSALVHHRLQRAAQWSLYELAVCRVLLFLQPDTVVQRYSLLIRTSVHRYRHYPQAETWVELLFSLLHYHLLARSSLASAVLADIQGWHQAQPFQSLALRLQLRFYTGVADYLHQPQETLLQRLHQFPALAQACDSPHLAQRMADLVTFLKPA